MNNERSVPGRAKQLEDPAVVASFYWKTGYQQNIGSRKEQQDSFRLALGVYRDKPALLAVLADGMGGMSDGAAFSRITAEYHQEHFQEALDTAYTLPGVLLTLARGANKAANQIFDETRPGGTTLIAALFSDDRFCTLSVGDSRIYLFRKNARLDCYVPLQLNREHVLGPILDERAWMGTISFEDAEENMYRESLSSSIGGERVRRVDLPYSTTKFLSGDRIVLMSDGIYRSASDAELSEALKLSPDKASDLIVENILKKKLPHQDNMSIVIIERV